MYSIGFILCVVRYKVMIVMFLYCTIDNVTSVHMGAHCLYYIL